MVKQGVAPKRRYAAASDGSHVLVPREGRFAGSYASPARAPLCEICRRWNRLRTERAGGTARDGALHAPCQRGVRANMSAAKKRARLLEGRYLLDFSLRFMRPLIPVAPEPHACRRLRHPERVVRRTVSRCDRGGLPKRGVSSSRASSSCCGRIVEVVTWQTVGLATFRSEARYVNSAGTVL